MSIATIIDPRPQKWRQNVQIASGTASGYIAKFWAFWPPVPLHIKVRVDKIINSARVINAVKPKVFPFLPC